MIQQNWTEERPYCIYKHTSPSGKVYIGQTCKQNLEERWCGGNGYKKCEFFERAIEKYGWNNFKHEIVAEELTKDEADNLEVTLIAAAKSLGISYNLRDGGSLLTDNDRKRISEKLKGKMVGEKNGFYGKKHPNRNKIIVCKNNTIKHIEKKQLKNYVNNGWEVGLPVYHRIKLSQIFKDRVWIKKDDQTKQIKREELDEYLKEGWVKGRISNEKWCKPCSDDKKQKIANKNKGGVYVNKEGVCKHIKNEELDEYLKEGWVKGQLKPSSDSFKKQMKNRRFINNGVINKFVKSDEIEDFLKEGWTTGKLKKDIL